jgi:hypothetical protein
MDKDRNDGLLIRMELYEFRGARSRYFLTFFGQHYEKWIGGYKKILMNWSRNFYFTFGEEHPIFRKSSSRKPQFNVFLIFAEIGS